MGSGTRCWSNVLVKVLEQPNGLILVTGPTGSGKSTSLYASLAEVHKPDINICTVEDPVEFNLAGVNQFQVYDRSGFSFATALWSLLRQDPDVIMAVAKSAMCETGADLDPGGD